VENKPINL